MGNSKFTSSGRISIAFTATQQAAILRVAERYNISINSAVRVVLSAGMEALAAAPVGLPKVA